MKKLCTAEISDNALLEIMSMYMHSGRLKTETQINQKQYKLIRKKYKHTRTRSYTRWPKMLSLSLVYEYVALIALSFCNCLKLAISPTRILHTVATKEKFYHFAKVILNVYLKLKNERTKKKGKKERKKLGTSK